MDAPTVRRLTLISLSWVLWLALLPASAVWGDADPVFPVDRFEVVYAEPHPDLPALESLLPLEVRLTTGPEGLAAPGPGSTGGDTRVVIGTGSAAGRYHASAIAAISSAVLERVRSAGLVGVFVTPHPADIDVHTERDLRPPDRRTLRLQISIGRVRELRSVAVGDRILDDWKINNPAHREIRRQSPIQPAALVREDTTDLVLVEELEDYLFRLNRHSGRRVEAALGGAEDGDGVALDLRVQEARPWFVYAQTSNTGTPRTAVWQNSVGVVHRQLTGRDDILALQYTNAGGDRVHALSGSYEAPWFGRRRPDWWRTQPDESIWQRWLHRDVLPWWGVDRLRWRIDGSWSRFDAKNVGLVDDIRGEEWQFGSRLIYETLQFRNFFVDTFAGTRMRKVSVFNASFQATEAGAADEFFFLPEVGIEFERVQETSTFQGLVAFEINVANTSETELQNLGRPGVDGQWKRLRYDVGLSQYLEPLLFPKDWEDPSTPSSSTLSHEFALGVRGQYAFDQRLIPQASQVLGGLFSVRGYSPSASVGDSVWVASAEYRFHVPRALPIQREPLRVPVLGDFRAAPQQVYGRPDWDLVLKGFVDAGRTERNRLGDGTRPPNEMNETLLGVGVGGELLFRHNWTVRVDWGHALKDAGCTGQPPQQRVCDVDKGDNEVHFLFNVVY